MLLSERFAIVTFYLGCEFQGNQEENLQHEGTCGYRGLQKTSEQNDERVRYVLGIVFKVCLF